MKESIDAFEAILYKDAMYYAYTYVMPMYRIFCSAKSNEIFYKKKVKHRFDEYLNSHAQ